MKDEYRKTLEAMLETGNCGNCSFCPFSAGDHCVLDNDILDNGRYLVSEIIKKLLDKN